MTKRSLPIAGQKQARQWRSVAELAAPPEPSREFSPASDLLDDGTSRRSVLQLLGASAALATL